MSGDWGNDAGRVLSADVHLLDNINLLCMLWMHLFCNLLHAVAPSISLAELYVCPGMMAQLLAVSIPSFPVCVLVSQSILIVDQQLHMSGISRVLLAILLLF